MENEKTVLKDYAELELNLHKEKHQAAMEVCFIWVFL
jgi:hypothetical protein